MIDSQAHAPYRYVGSIICVPKKVCKEIPREIWEKNTFYKGENNESKKTSNVELPTYVKELEKLNPLEMTPLEALTYLFELQKKVKEGK